MVSKNKYYKYNIVIYISFVFKMLFETKKKSLNDNEKWENMSEN